MDPVEKLSPRWTEEYLTQLRYTLDLNAKQTLELTERNNQLTTAVMSHCDNCMRRDDTEMPYQLCAKNTTALSNPHRGVNSALPTSQDPCLY